MSHVKKHRNIFQFKLILVILTLLINPLFSYASKISAENFVNEVTKKVTDVLDNKQMSKSNKKHHLEELFEKYIDIPWIAKFTLGRYIRSASKNQIEEFNILFAKYLKDNYVSNFSNFSSNNIIIDSVTETKQNEYLVKTIVTNTKTNNNISINFQLYHKNNDHFIVFDIIIEGISMIATQRSEFNSLFSSLGIDGTLKKLKEKIQHN